MRDCRWQSDCVDSSAICSRNLFQFYFLLIIVAASAAFSGARFPLTPEPIHTRLCPSGLFIRRWCSASRPRRYQSCLDDAQVGLCGRITLPCCFRRRSRQAVPNNGVAGYATAEGTGDWLCTLRHHCSALLVNRGSSSSWQAGFTLPCSSTEGDLLKHPVYESEYESIWRPS